MKEIIILLTKYSDFTSNIIYYICGRGYTHSSIALEDAPEKFYSFNYRGFVIETVEKYRRHGVRHSRSYKVQISDEAYKKIREQIDVFIENRENYRYNSIGVVFCIAGLPLRRK